MFWWERYPGALEAEIRGLEVAEMTPEINRGALASGKVCIEIKLAILGKETSARIIYPDLYPFFRPRVYAGSVAPDLRHYNPGTGEICLVSRRSQFWQPSMTAAYLIQQMLPEWNDAAVLPYDVPRIATEDHQAEPATVYLPYEPGQLLLMDGAWKVPDDIESGTFTVALPDQMKKFSRRSKSVGRVTEISFSGRKGDLGIAADEHVLQWVKSHGYGQHQFHWTRIGSLPSGRTGGEILHFLAENYPVPAKRIQEEIRRGRTGIHGFCFLEEAPRGGMREGWFFIGFHGGNQRTSVKPDVWLIKAEYAGERDSFERIPELSRLSQKKIAVVGLGCVGAPSVLAMARAGIGEIRLLDSDRVGAGTICRWPFGFPAIGDRKVAALSEFISVNYPWTNVRGSHAKESIGDEGIPLGEIGSISNQWDVVETLLDGVDALYDATAEEEVNYFLSTLARQYKIPHIAVSSRPGGWGGSVVRIRPDGSTGCFLCYLQNLKDGTFPQPPFDPHGNDLQPAGCGEVTFTGAGFDVEEISLAGVRMLVSTLGEGGHPSYPHNIDDVGILSLRKNGMSIFPEWKGFKLPIHHECKHCNP